MLTLIITIYLTISLCLYSFVLIRERNEKVSLFEFSCYLLWPIFLLMLFIHSRIIRNQSNKLINYLKGRKYTCVKCNQYLPSELGFWEGFKEEDLDEPQKLFQKDFICFECREKMR